MSPAGITCHAAAAPVVSLPVLLLRLFEFAAVLLLKAWFVAKVASALELAVRTIVLPPSWVFLKWPLPLLAKP